MALMITVDCSSCDACREECPNQAISEGNGPHVIDPLKCTECVGYFDTPQCVDVCPVACILPDPAYRETPAELQIKFEALQG